MINQRVLVNLKTALGSAFAVRGIVTAQDSDFTTLDVADELEVQTIKNSFSTRVSQEATSYVVVIHNANIAGVILL